MSSNQEITYDDKPITEKEANDFFSAAEEEINKAMVTKTMLCKSPYLICARAKDTSIVGVGGFRITMHMPSLFLVVKKSHQRAGIGRILTGNVIREAQKRYGYLTLSTYDTEEYAGAIKIYSDLGFRRINQSGSKIWMTNSKGIVNLKILTTIKLLLPLRILMNRIKTLFNKTKR